VGPWPLVVVNCQSPVMVKPRSRRPPPIHLSPKPNHFSPCPSSAFEEFADFDASYSRPSSGVFRSASSSPHLAMGAQPPSLTDILLDAAPPPWTLSAFMAYLSQNHCMETLEFTLDSQRYAAFYEELAASPNTAPDGLERCCSLWEKLMQVYIVPCAPREVNIPARVRDRLLNLSYRPQPPRPSELDEAGRIVFELMNDSLLVPFIESVSVLHLDTSIEHGRTMRHPSHTSRVHSAAHLTDSEGLTDDSDAQSPLALEPMTPPTTPPTTDFHFGVHSPSGLGRAMAASNKGWSKLGAKLGFNRKSSSGRRTSPTSGTQGSSGDSIHTNSL
jgi:hypothetical protein